MASGRVAAPPVSAEPAAPPPEEPSPVPPPVLPFTVRYGIKPAKRVIDNNAGSILADADPPVVLSSAEEHRLRTAFSNTAPADPTGGGKLNREGIRAVLKELGVPGISDDLLLARYFSRRSEPPGEDVRLSIEELIEVYKAVAAPSRQYGERLRRACARGEDPIIRDLIARGTNPNLGDGAGQTSVHYAAEYGQTGVIQLLKELCGDSLLIDAQDKWGWSPLTTAVIHNQQQVLELLVSMGAKLESCNKEGRTALHWAASKGREQAVQTLISSGIDVNLKDRSSWTALHYACINGHVPVIKLLIRGGANAQVLDILDYPPQHYVGEEAWQRLKKELSERRGSASRRGSKGASVPESYPKELIGSQYSTVTS